MSEWAIGKVNALEQNTAHTEVVEISNFHHPVITVMKVRESADKTLYSPPNMTCQVVYLLNAWG